MNTKGTHAVLLAVLLAGLAAMASCAVHRSVAARHPVEVLTMPICSECHKDGRTTLDHRADFISRHRFYAAQQQQLCNACHAESFCSDCHGNKEELKPSDKYKDSPARSLPHRGDYLNQHKIDGTINPASCFPCHGRQNNGRCRVCHR
jgi:hypothetical protein